METERLEQEGHDNRTHGARIWPTEKRLVNRLFALRAHSPGSRPITEFRRAEQRLLDPPERLGINVNEFLRWPRTSDAHLLTDIRWLPLPFN
jgi:hypothetical protein